MIECAVRADLSVPAKDFLDAFGEGIWAADPHADSLPDDAQVKHYDKLLAWFQLLADEGVPPYKDAINDLDEGIWEFKIGSARLSYYDTDGLGGYVPKYRIWNRDESPFSDNEFWWYPELDDQLRLGHYFPKEAQEAGALNVSECELVRDEDLNHDG